MKEYRGTRESILDAARGQFLEYGYNRASLRKIAAAAGVTTGAIYFLFEGKSDLWKAVLHPMLKDIIRAGKDHGEEELRQMKQGRIADEEVDLRACRRILDIFYAHPVETKLFFSHQDHPYVQEVLHTIVKHGEQRMREYIEQIGCESDSAMIHMFSHIQLNLFSYVIEHSSTREEAMEQAIWMVKFLRGGFHEVISCPR